MNQLLFSIKILTWYKHNKRDLPWRGISDPYKVWISEIILQQTRIDQGISYYYNFIKRFPNIESLASATEDEVLKIWQGLGYYSRARNLFFGAKQILNNFNGIFPDQSKNLKKIKGIGEYTAAAISSIVYNEKIAAIDGNVYRVLSRCFGIETPIDTTEGQKQFKILANQLIDQKNPGDFNQAVMEFGALHCKPKNPDCTSCIFKNECQAFLTNTINVLPVKSKKTKQRNRYFNYLVINHNNSLIFKKRTKNDIWKNLFDFPLIETTKKTSIEKLSKSTQWNKMFNSQEISLNKVSKEYLHILTHQRIYVRFIHISLKSEKILPSDFISIDKKNTFELAVPKIIEKYMSENILIE